MGGAAAPMGAGQMMPIGTTQMVPMGARAGMTGPSARQQYMGNGMAPSLAMQAPMNMMGGATGPGPMANGMNGMPGMGAPGVAGAGVTNNAAVAREEEEEEEEGGGPHIRPPGSQRLAGTSAKPYAIEAEQVVTIHLGRASRTTRRIRHPKSGDDSAGKSQEGQGCVLTTVFTY